jgi:hypothetical protein
METLAIEEAFVGHRWFNAVIVIFWLSTMTWLVIAKVLPPLQIGEPPSYRSIYAVARDERPEPVCWDLLWNDRSMGWARTQVQRTHADVTEVRSLVHFDRVPVDELAPAWMRPIVRRAVEPIGALAMDANSRIEIDPLGRLSAFRSTMWAQNHPEAIIITGKVQGTMLKGSVRTGRIQQPFERYLPPDALMGDELSPQAHMPGLNVGQQWTVPVYSPLRSSGSNNPIEILQAKVEGHEMVTMGDETIKTLAVEYRSDSGAILTGSHSLRGKLWVADDGTVLKQTAYLFGSQLTFLRAGKKRAKEVLDLAEKQIEIMRKHSASRGNRGPISSGPLESARWPIVGWPQDPSTGAAETENREKSPDRARRETPDAASETKP